VLEEFVRLVIKNYQLKVFLRPEKGAYIIPDGLRHKQRLRYSRAVRSSLEVELGGCDINESSTRQLLGSPLKLSLDFRFESLLLRPHVGVLHFHRGKFILQSLLLLLTFNLVDLQSIF